MKYGVNLFLWTAAFTKKSLSLLPKVAEMGFDGVEVPLDLLDQIDVKGTKRALVSNELGCTCCGVIGADRDLISEDESIRKSAKNYLKRCLQICSEWEADVLCGPLYSAVGKIPGRSRSKKEWNLAVEGLKEMATEAEKYGVTLAIEPLNRYETYFLNTAEDALKLIYEINHPNLKLHLDTYHMNVEEKNFYKSIKQAGESLFHIHCCENDRGTPGTGHVDWQGVFKALHEINYNRWIVIESFVPGVKEIAKAASIWREICSSADILASDGLKFLKSMENSTV